jgi:hypothetical protein
MVLMVAIIEAGLATASGDRGVPVTTVPSGGAATPRLAAKPRDNQGHQPHHDDEKEQWTHD